MNHKGNSIRRSLATFALAITCCVLFQMQASAQSAAQTMIDQIAKFATYLGYLKQGYDIVNQGLTFIGDIKKGDLDMHTNYFNSLETANPEVKNYDKVGAIIAMQVKILADYNTFMNSFKNSKTFSSAEISYLISVYGTLLIDMASDVGELTEVITDGQLQMKDDERLERIDGLYTKVSSQYDFFYSFSSQTNTQMLQRKQSLNEIQNLQKLIQP